MRCVVCGAAVSNPEYGHRRCDAHMVSERWVPVRGYEGLYEASSLGRVRSLKRRLNGRIYGGGLLRQTKCSPYKMLDLSKGNNRKKHLVHRLILSAFSDPQDKLCRHLDGDDQNNELDNLCWGGFIENESDKKRHDRHGYGDRNAGSKLTWDDVNQIRELAHNGRSGGSIARIFGISRSQCNKIIKGTSWSHDGDPRRRERRRAYSRGEKLKSSVKTISNDTVFVIQIRLLIGESQRDIAKSLGVSQAYVSLVSRGERGPVTTHDRKGRSDRGNPCGRYIATDQGREVAA